MSSTPSTAPESTRATSFGEELTDLLQRLAALDDRATVILAGAMLDLQLSSLLRKALRPSTTSRDAMLDDRGFVTSLYAKAHLSQRLGLIDLELFRAIDFIRDVRNLYAHELQYAELAHSRFASAIDKKYQEMKADRGFLKAVKLIFGPDHSALVKFKALATLVMSRLERALAAQDCIAQQTPLSYRPPSWSRGNGVTGVA